MVTSRRGARINLQPSLASPLVHLSGGSAQQELSAAAEERARLLDSDEDEDDVVGPDDELQESGEFEQEAGPAARRMNNREEGRARLYDAVMICRQFVVLKWLLQILSEGGPTGVWCILTCLALMIMLGSFQDDRGNSVGTWFNSLVAWKIARALAINVLDAGLYGGQPVLLLTC